MDKHARSHNYIRSATCSKYSVFVWVMNPCWTQVIVKCPPSEAEVSIYGLPYADPSAPVGLTGAQIKEVSKLEDRAANSAVKYQT